MTSLLLLIPIAILLGTFSLGLFLWALKSKQFDDLEGDAQRILFEDSLDAPSLPQDPLPQILNPPPPIKNNPPNKNQ